MLDLNNIIRNNGSDLIVSFSILDINGNAVIAAQGFQTNIQRLSDGNWWNIGTPAFDVGAEPALINGVQNGTTGIYEYTLTGGYDGTSQDYIVRLKGITTVTFDFYESVRLKQDLVAVTAAVDSALDAANTLLASPANVDTGSLRDMIQTAANILQNKKLETDILQTIRNRVDGANFATRSIGDAAGTLTVGAAT